MMTMVTMMTMMTMMKNFDTMLINRIYLLINYCFINLIILIGRDNKSGSARNHTGIDRIHSYQQHCSP